MQQTSTASNCRLFKDEHETLISELRATGDLLEDADDGLLKFVHAMLYCLSSHSASDLREMRNVVKVAKQLR